MANPVIIDDGGSTRIKHFRLGTAVGAMDGLLDVEPNGAGIGQSDHAFPSPLGAFTTLVVSSIDPVTGATRIAPAVPALVAGDRIEVVSGPFKVHVEIGAGGTSTLKVLGSAAVDPQVDAKQHRKKRRYIVSNAPPIDTVTLIRGAASTLLFDDTVTPSVYTFVHLS